MIYIFSPCKTKEYLADPLYEYIYTDKAGDVLRNLLSNGDGAEIIGLIRGERFPVRNDQPLIEPYIDRVMERFDLILPYETEKNGRQFDASVIIGRRDTLREIFELPLNDPVYLNDNIRLSSHIRHIVREKGYRVKSEQISKAEPEKWNAGYERIEVLQRYIDTILAEYIGLRNQSGFEECFAEDDPYQGDFDGKIPVWVCWWQGLDDAPELVRACVSSVIGNLPEYCVPVLITLDNWSEYVTFTPAVINKFNRRIITYTHLADMLRSELIYRYGGLWIDATYYVSRTIPDTVFDQEFFSLAFDKPLWGMDIMRGRWSSSLLGAKQRHTPVMQFIMEGLWLYWEHTDETIDYFFWDYIFDAGYRHFEEIRRLVDSVIPSPPAAYDLQLEMNQRISARETERLHREFVFYKINRRGEYHKQTEHGFRTFYAYIVDGYCEDHGEESDGGTITQTIECNSESEIIRAVREVNPYRIVDVNGFFKEKKWISLGMIDDFILHELQVEYPEPGAVSTATNVYDPIAILIVENRYRLKLYDS